MRLEKWLSGRTKLVAHVGLLAGSPIWCHRNGERLTNLVRLSRRFISRARWDERREIACRAGLENLKNKHFQRKDLRQAAAAGPRPDVLAARRRWESKSRAKKELAVLFQENKSRPVSENVAGRLKNPCG